MTTMAIPLPPDLVSRLREKIHRESGGSRNPVLAEKIDRPLGAAIEVASRKTSPMFTCRVIKILSSNDHAVLTEFGPIRSAMFARLVNRCEEDRQVVSILATIGNTLEEAAKSCGDLLDQWIFDRVGSELAEMTINAADDLVRATMFGSNMQFSKRISPGYCDWAIEGQKMIFNSLDAENINVSLSPYLLMTPQKSISGVMAASKNVRIKNPCARCPNAGCPWRRV